MMLLDQSENTTTQIINTSESKPGSLNTICNLTLNSNDLKCFNGCTTNQEDLAYQSVLSKISKQATIPGQNSNTFSLSKNSQSQITR